jgi:hypothetical protein
MDDANQEGELVDSRDWALLATLHPNAEVDRVDWMPSGAAIVHLTDGSVVEYHPRPVTAYVKFGDEPWRSI